MILALLLGLCAGLVIVLRMRRDQPATPPLPMTDDERLQAEDPAAWHQRQRDGS